MLTVLPGPLRKELEESLVSLDTARIKVAIKQASAIDDALGLALTHLADDFEYQEILNALAAGAP